MKCFVTGASGFVGANLVHELRARGHEVKALLRRDSDLRGLRGADFERIEGDVSDGEKLKSAMRGCDWCFHVAASYHLWLRDYKPMYAANVEGTRNVIEAAASAGCSRIVYTSTVGCIGLPGKGGTGNAECGTNGEHRISNIEHRTDERGTRKSERGKEDGEPTSKGGTHKPECGNEQIIPTDEATPVSEVQMSNHYKLSKWQAEVVARELAARGLPVVIVNPSAPIGPRDVKPTPTGRVIVDFLNRQMPAYLDTGLNWVHVRDVAIGHILAAEKGRIGERYILGNAQGNWTMKEAFAVLEKITGIPAPRFQVPYSVALLAAHVDEMISSFTAKPPKAPLAGVRMARYKMFFNPAKAIHELGLPQTSPEKALADAVEWFREYGYVKS